MSTREDATGLTGEAAESAALRSPFERQVHDILVRLYDHVYLQAHALARTLHEKGILPGPQYGQTLRRELTKSIEMLKPEPASNSEASRGYDILCLRYVEGLDPTEVQKQLSLSRRQYYREHQRAFLALVLLLREQWGLDERTHEHLPTEAPSLLPTPSAAAPFAATQAEETADLPTALTSFVGRQREMAIVRQLLATARLLTLTGSGGCGKTRLALQVAADLAKEYPDGVQAIELASLTDPELVPQTIAFALGIHDDPSQTITQSLVKYLRRRQVLLVLDNCEHLIEACARLAETLLHECPRLQVLVTSREALGIGGETRWRVPSLGAPRPERWADDAAEVGKHEAVQLFVERARAVQPDFLLAADNARAVAEVCWRLDGIPLAIELAAARVRVLAVAQIARRLDDRFRLLTDGSRTALPRYRTLQATIDWSHDLLDPRAAALFRRLAVFAGGCTLEAAEGVCTGDGVEIWQVLDLLGQLVDKSLVQVEAGEEEPRFRLLETIREYAESKLAEAGEEEEARRRHRDWFVAFAERELPHTVGREQARCLPRLAAEHANFRAALRSCRSDPDGAEAELRLVSALGRYWRWIGRWAEAADWLDNALARRHPVVSGTWARALTTRGLIEALYIGDLDLALALAAEAVTIARAVGDPRLLDLALRQEGLVHVSRGDIQAAQSRIDEALAVARRAGDDREACSALVQQALLCSDPRDLGAIVLQMDQALSVARTLGDGVLLTEALAFLGGTLIYAKDYARAETALAEALVSARTASYFDVLGWVVVLLGDIALIGGDRAGTLQRYGEALARELDRGSEGLAVDALVRVAALAAEGGEREAAARLFAWCEVQKTRRAVVWLHWMFDRLGRPETETLHERALAAARESLGEAAFARAWQAGRAMTPEEAGELGRAVLTRLQAAE